MSANLPPPGTVFVLDVPAFAQLFPALERRGYAIVAPVVRGPAIVYDLVRGIEDLPAGWTAEQEAGYYRLRKRNDGALFGYAVGAQGLKRFLNPPEVRLMEARRSGRGFEIAGSAEPAPHYAFIGVRSCELGAMAIQDRVLLGEFHSDATYEARRRGLFLAAVNCTVAAPTCFCASVHSAPPAQAGFDLALTELVDGERHFFVAEAGSRQGGEVLAELNPGEADATTRREADQAIRSAISTQVRRLETEGLREALYEQFDNPHWDDIAGRCLACCNCTMVCPTCFCTTVEDSSDVSGSSAERWRKWDSCFTQSFSYIHGGSVRMSGKARYRQWLTHKLAAWIDQFGTSGCVGCGRCITWCPAGIDITREAAALAPAGAAPAPRRALP